MTPKLSASRSPLIAHPLHRWLLQTLEECLAEQFFRDGGATPPTANSLAPWIAQLLRGLDQVAWNEDAQAVYIQAITDPSSLPDGLQGQSAALRAQLRKLSLPQLCHAFHESTLSVDTALFPLLREISLRFPSASAGDADAGEQLRSALDAIDALLPLAASPPVNVESLPAVSASEASFVTPAPESSALQASRAAVAAELDLRDDGHHLHDAVRNALLGGWEPLMTMRHLLGGSASGAWSDGLLLLDDILASFRDNLDQEQLTFARASIRRLDRAMEQAGFADSRRQELISPVEQLCDEAEQFAGIDDDGLAIADDGSLSDRSRQLLLAIAAPGSWIRIVEQEQEEERWLQVASHDVSLGFIELTTVSSREPLGMFADELMMNLRSGRIEPLDPSPQCAMALRAIRSV